jgi:hypothetical protein
VQLLLKNELEEVKEEKAGGSAGLFLLEMGSIS